MLKCLLLLPLWSLRVRGVLILTLIKKNENSLFFTMGICNFNELFKLCFKNWVFGQHILLNKLCEYFKRLLRIMGPQKN